MLLFDEFWFGRSIRRSAEEILSLTIRRFSRVMRERGFEDCRILDGPHYDDLYGKWYMHVICWTPEDWIGCRNYTEFELTIDSDGTILNIRPLRSYRR